MYQALTEKKRDGVAGNARLTGATAAALLVLLAAEGATIPFIGSLLEPHVFIFLRLLAPGVVLTTVVLFGTGVALLVAGPPSNTMIFLHKLSFIAWVALMTLHVLGHLLEVPLLASADWRRGSPREARLAGAGARTLALGTSLLAGFALAALTFSAASPWF